MANHPLIRADYPDVDVIRVGDTYYMISTTMHFFPGGVILRSHDLVHWETAGHVFDALDHTPAQRLDGGSIYSKGMWAAALRYHDGLFRVLFVANDTHKTYCFTAPAVEGPWSRHDVEGFYHDASLLFDDDGRVYIVSGNRSIRMTEMEPDLSRPKEGGLDKIILRDEGRGLGYEGSHLYKIDGRYYLCLIHWPAGHMRTEAVFSAASPEGPWEGGDVLEDDMGFFRQGVAQGGMVQTPDGEWYAVLFQDHGAAGRMPVLVPVVWRDGRPRFLSPSLPCLPKDLRPGHAYRSLCAGGDFTAPEWEWNHEPDLSLVRLGKDALTLTTDRTAEDVTLSKNTLTARTFDPGCAACVTVRGAGMKDGDAASLAALQGLWAEAALVREGDSFFAVMREKTDEGIFERARVPLADGAVRLRAVFDFRSLADTVSFAYEKDGDWLPLGTPHKLFYRLDHFTGVRVGLAYRSARTAGGSAEFSDFRFRADGD